MKLTEFLKKIRIEYSSWDDYGFKKTAFLSVPGYENFFIKIHPNNDEHYKRILNKDHALFKEEDHLFYGVNDSYYEMIQKVLDESEWNDWYKLTGDIAYNYSNTRELFTDYYSNTELNEVMDEEESKRRQLMDILGVSFFRDSSMKDVLEKLLTQHRMTKSENYLSDYHFTVKDQGKVMLEVDIIPKEHLVVEDEIEFFGEKRRRRNIISKNVYGIIGDNGSGKTRFLRLFMMKLMNIDQTFEINYTDENTSKDANIISKIVYLSYSPFDSMSNIKSNDSDNGNRIPLVKIGLVNSKLEEKNLDEYMNDELFKIIQELRQPDRTTEYNRWFEVTNNLSFERWILSIQELVSSKVKEVEEAGEITVSEKDEYSKSVNKFEDSESIKKGLAILSSGQKIILLSITKLILEVVERTVVLIDEPELFLHPPMIKGYIRAISEIVTDANGICLLVTHSPISLQEIHSDCVRIARKNQRNEFSMEELTGIKTFGENVNIINNEIFKVGMQQTGYYDFLNMAQRSDKLKEMKDRLNDILGSEGKTIMTYLLLEENDAANKGTSK